MNEVVWLDEYSPEVDYTTPILSQGKNVVFVRSDVCMPNHFHVRSNGSELDVELRYKNYTDANNICSGTTYTTRMSESDGYFYFDRTLGDFISMSDYDPGNPKHIRVFLPYAEYSHNASTAGFYDYWTWYDYNYMNWIFYYTNQAERDALEAQHWVPEERTVLTRVLAAKQAVRDLVEGTPGVRFGLMIFNGDNGNNDGGQLITEAVI